MLRIAEHCEKTMQLHKHDRRYLVIHSAALRHLLRNTLPHKVQSQLPWSLVPGAEAVTPPGSPKQNMSIGGMNSHNHRNRGINLTGPRKGFAPMLGGEMFQWMRLIRSTAGWHFHVSYRDRSGQCFLLQYYVTMSKARVRVWPLGVC